ncbi:hypothetical protein DVH05_016284 [Phytophthora capsici]|nr:hypothetical protein DVH05_016284 [Phytophthora capsici]
MAKVLTKLVAKTADWSVEKLRDELLMLNKLAYPYRHRFDRSELMMVRASRKKEEKVALTVLLFVVCRS